MGSSNKYSNGDSALVQRSEELVDRFLDAIWMERGLSENTLGAYRADLLALTNRLDERGINLLDASRADVMDYISWRVEGGAKAAVELPPLLQIFAARRRSH